MAFDCLEKIPSNENDNMVDLNKPLISLIIVVILLLLFKPINKPVDSAIANQWVVVNLQIIKLSIIR